jgi:hypothetical protein
MGADCTEYSALLVALSRAQGSGPLFRGLLALDEDTRDLARVEHAWADAYARHRLGVDRSTLGRSAINRKTYFAHHHPDHIIVTLGANPSTLRGRLWTHIYWPGDSTQIHVEADPWEIEPVE